MVHTGYVRLKCNAPKCEYVLLLYLILLSVICIVRRLCVCVFSELLTKVTVWIVPLQGLLLSPTCSGAANLLSFIMSQIFFLNKQPKQANLLVCGFSYLIQILVIKQVLMQAKFGKIIIADSLIHIVCLTSRLKLWDITQS